VLAVAFAPRGLLGALARIGWRKDSSNG
jgi:hypothetical protein